jgi:superfamily I DNA/RNA helicase
MIEHFTNSEKIKSEDLGIKILIVDEAQDSSVIQEAAEKKMAAAVDIFYKAGDPDQSLFGFAGANPDEFHKEFAHPEEELEQGFRCPRIINEYCKQIIRPIWDHYGYTRVWAPRRELDKDGKPTGPIVEGEKFELMNLEQDPNLAELTKRITQTGETFAFTYRGNEPKEIIKYLVKTGVPFRIVDKHQKFKFKYPTAGINNQRNFFKLINKNEEVSAAGAKSILKNILSEYAGKNYSKEAVDELGTGKIKYDIEWLIKHQFLSPSVKETDDFQNISETINKAKYLETIEIKNFIRSVTKYDPLDSLKKNPRIFLENIHTIKGKEFDNTVVDLTILREEDDYTKRRIKYVACSRARKTLWLIKSKNGMTL